MNIKPSWTKLKETLKNSYTSYLPNSVLLDENLHHSSKTVFAIINAMCFNKNNEMTDTCYPSQALIGYLAGGVSTKTVSRAVTELEKYGYIKITHNKGFTNTYRIVARFAQKVVNQIKNKAAEIQQTIKGKKNNKQSKPSNWNLENQREYTDQEFDLLERQLLGWTEPSVNMFGEEYQQVCII